MYFSFWVSILVHWSAFALLLCFCLQYNTGYLFASVKASLSASRDGCNSGKQGLITHGSVSTGGHLFRKKICECPVHFPTYDRQGSNMKRTHLMDQASILSKSSESSGVFQLWLIKLWDWVPLCIPFCECFVCLRHFRMHGLIPIIFLTLLPSISNSFYLFIPTDEYDQHSGQIKWP